LRSFVAFIDANVIYPMALCDTVLRLAERELFRPLLSEAVLKEARRNLVADGRCNEEQARHRMVRIQTFFESSIVTGYELLEAGLTCDPKDRHVLAAAIAGGANQLVTSNVRDFPKESTEPYDIEVVTPDVFLQNVFDLYTDITVAEIRAQAARLRNPPHTIDDVLRALSSTVPNFSQSVLTEIARQNNAGRRRTP
jgi:predicted nucleic acid-binding protein